VTVLGNACFCILIFVELLEAFVAVEPPSPPVDVLSIPKDVDETLGMIAIVPIVVLTPKQPVPLPTLVKLGIKQKFVLAVLANTTLHFVCTPSYDRITAAPDTFLI
jgi:hypothetical protein